MHKNRAHGYTRLWTPMNKTRRRQRVGKAQARAQGIEIDPHVCGNQVFWPSPFLPSLIPNLHLQYLNMSGASVLAGAHDFVALDNTFNTANTVSRMVII